MSFETKGRKNLQETADVLVESIVFCPLVPPSWISLVDPTSAMYASEIYVSYIYAFTAVRNQFEIDTLFPEQELAIKTFMEKDNVFINLPTGYGKSLIYQCMPLVADILNGNPRGTSVLVVISPLKALMEDQVEYLGNVGISAIAVEDNTDPELVQMIKNGVFMVVYCSAECSAIHHNMEGNF